MFDRLQRKSQRMQLMQGGLDAPRHDLHTACQTAGRSYRQPQLIRRQVALVRYVAGDQAIGQAITLKDPNRHRRGIAAPQLLQQRFFATSQSHGTRTHGKVILALDGPARILPEQTGSHRVIGGHTHPGALPNRLLSAG